MLKLPHGRSLLIAGLVLLRTFAQPAHATTLTVTQLSCETLRAGFMCEAYVGGGTGSYTYTWNVLAKSRYDTANSSRISVSCTVGTTRSVTFTVTDSSGATASKTTSVYCSGGTP